MSLIKIFCADFSMNMPGFAMLVYDEETRSVVINKTSYLNNHAYTTHGEKLRSTANEIRAYFDMKPDVCVR